MQKQSNFLVHELIMPFEGGALLSFPEPRSLYHPPSDKAQYLHYHRSLEIGLCMEGSGIFYIGNSIFPFSAGDISVITPGTVHIAQSRKENPGGWKFFDINLDGLSKDTTDNVEITNAFLSGNFNSTVIYKGSEPEILSLCSRILSEYEEKPKHFSTSLTALSTLLLISLSRLENDGSTFSSQPTDFEDITPAIFFLLENYNKRIDVDHLCDLCNLSASSFRRKFRDAFGMSPSQYLYNIRIKAATGLLRTTSLPITEISELVGYETLSSFLRHFGRIMGTNPTGYRRTSLTSRSI